MTRVAQERRLSQLSVELQTADDIADFLQFALTLDDKALMYTPARKVIVTDDEVTVLLNCNVNGEPARLNMQKNERPTWTFEREMSGSPGRMRTYNPPVISHMNGKLPAQMRVIPFHETYCKAATFTSDHWKSRKIIRNVLRNVLSRACCRAAPIPQNLPLPGFEGELSEIPIRAEGLSVTKSLAWRADNDNPMAPLFLKMAKQ